MPIAANTGDAAFYGAVAQAIPVLFIALALEMKLFRFRKHQLQNVDLTFALLGVITALALASGSFAFVGLATENPAGWLKWASAVGLGLLAMWVALGLLLSWLDEAEGRSVKTGQSTKAHFRRLELWLMRGLCCVVLLIAVVVVLFG